MSLSLQAAPQTPKLRSSCDSCGTAKIKCDRSHPKCGRCLTLGLACIYGVSRKNGKRPRRSPGAGLGRSAEKRTCTGAIAHKCHQDLMPEIGVSRVANEPGQNAVLDFTNNLAPASCNAAEESQPASASFLTFPMEDWYHLDTFGIGGLAFPGGPMLEADRASSTNSDKSESHSCPRESYEIFRDLICPSPSLHAPDSNSVTVSAQLDQVLLFNRNAIDRLGQVLRCPCSKSGHRAMVHASIVSRILIWYQQAAGWTCTTINRSRPSMSPDVSTHSDAAQSPPLETADGTGSANAHPSVQATGFSVDHVPLSLGSFTVEDQNVQTALRIQLVLGELKHTARLIDLFFSEIGDESCAGGGVVGLYSHLGQWLRNEHSRTVKILKARLGVLNESLDS